MKIKIIDAKRTAIGKFLGSFYECDPCDVCAQLIKSFDKNILRDVNISIFGNAIPAGLGQGFARKISLNAGLNMETTNYSVNMVCGSGMQSIINACKEILTGEDVVLCGGFEFMSNIPYATDTYLRLGKKFGDFTMVDLMKKDGLIDSFSGVHMGITAENIAESLHISRKEQDNYSFYAQKRAIDAVDKGLFLDEIVPINLKDYKGREFVFENDEFPNRNTTLEKLDKLKPSFKKDGTVTAGSSSGINDGASMLLLASEKYCIEKNINSPISICDYTAIGCNPQKMGLGPYYAIKKLLEKNNLKLEDIDVFEINEAFAAQLLGCAKLLCNDFNYGIEEFIKKTNVNGSGLALGHPLGSSGARIVVSLYHYMLKHDLRYGIASLCVGGGQGLSLLLKKG